MIPAVACLHDLSGVGRSSLSVILPVLSAMGAQALAAPTAVLSAHTMFPHVVMRDLTDLMEETLQSWISIPDLRVEAVYTGYFSSIKQAEIAERFINAWPEAMRIVDPVMGDHGRMYRSLPNDMPEAMRRLARGASVLTPNPTEAALLTCRAYEEAFSLNALETTLRDLCALGAETAMITGAVLEDGRHVNAWMREGDMRLLPYDPVPASYPGTGDLFDAVLTGALVTKRPFADAVTLAADYVRETILATVTAGTPPAHGVLFEKTLFHLPHPD